MKTWQAVLAHWGITASQAIIAAPVIAGVNPKPLLANPPIQIAVQAVLLALQAYLVKVNSNTDPNGKPLVENAATGAFTSKPAS